MRRLRPTLDQVWLVAALALVAFRSLLVPIPPHDFWWHLATGRIIATQGQIPTVDSFSYTRTGEPFYNQSWLAQLLFYTLHQIGGIPLLLLTQALVLTAAYALLLHLSVRQSGRLRLSAGLLLLGTIPASFDNWMVRPQTYAIPLFISYLAILTHWRRTGSPRWMLFILPVLGTVWVNLHGSFVLGGLLILLTFVAECVRRGVKGMGEQEQPPLGQLFLVGLLTGAGWLINPRGWQVLGYVGNLLGSSQVTQLVTEWAPPTIREPSGAIFFLFVIAAIVILSYAGRPPDPVDIFVAVVFLWIALGAGRNTIWFVAVATPLLARQLATWRPRVGSAFQGIALLNAAIITLIMILLIAALPWIKPHLGLPPNLGPLIDRETPVAAVEFLRNDVPRPQRLFHAMSVGSYLIWSAPEQLVWADPRIELYPGTQWRDYQQLSAGREVERLLAAYAIDGLLLSRREQGALIGWAAARPEQWELRYSDASTSYFRAVGRGD